MSKVLCVFFPWMITDNDFLTIRDIRGPGLKKSAFHVSPTVSEFCFRWSFKSKIVCLSEVIFCFNLTRHMETRPDICSCMHSSRKLTICIYYYIYIYIFAFTFTMIFTVLRYTFYFQQNFAWWLMWTLYIINHETLHVQKILPKVVQSIRIY